MHRTHPYWIVAVLGFTVALACLIYVVHDIRRDRRREKDNDNG